MHFYSHLDWPTPGTISHLFSHTYGFTEVDDPIHADIIVFNGGEDIATEIYAEQPVLRGIPLKKSPRDLDEIALFNSFKDDKTKLLVGICRGAQLLNCLNGGKLWQDVSGHQGSHAMVDLRTSETMRVTSTHHQMMIPNLSGGVIIGVSSNATYKRHEAGEENFQLVQNIKAGCDVEIMWYPDHRSLCIQGHPEYVPKSRFAEYSLELIYEFNGAEIVKAAS